MTKKELEFLRLLLLQDAEIKKLFSETVNQIAGELNQFSTVKDPLTVESIWLKNPRIEKKIEAALADFETQYTTLLTNAKADALGISKKYGDELINSYISRLPISQVVKEGIFARSLEAFETFSKKKLDLSSSVWKTSQVMKDQIAFYGASGVASGQSSKRIATDLKNYLEYPDKRFRRVRDPKTGKLTLSQPAKDFHPGRGVYRSSYQNALRTAQSEVNMSFRHADQARWSQMPFVNGYEVKLSNAHPEYDICDHMAGLYPKNFLFGGWHPKCICFVVPVMAPTKDFVSYLKTGNLNESRLIKSIPKGAQDYVEKMSPAYKNYKSKPYFLQDNFKLKGDTFELKKSVTSVNNMSKEKLLSGLQT